MSVIFLLVIIGVVVAGLFLAAFIWSVKSGQYEDSYSPSVRILFDDHKKTDHSESKSTETDKRHKNKKNSTNSIYK
jgi:cbb3-type cytochrome oxidase maturation protein